MPDYASYRDKLAALNERRPLRLWTGELLPATRTARPIEAADLQAVLDLRAAGRSVRDAIDKVAERHGLDTAELADWFTPTGDPISRPAQGGARRRAKRCGADGPVWRRAR